MDFRKWKHLLISWANVLKVCDQELISVDDFITSDFFPRLVCELYGEQTEKIRSIECAFKFLKGLYPSIDIGTSNLNEDDVVAAVTLFLVHCSLNKIPRDQALQVRVCSLPHNQQCLLKSLLERFVTTGNMSITKEKIFSELMLIGGENSTCGNSPLASFNTTPLNGVSNVKIINSSSNSTKRASKVRRLRNQIEHLTSLNAEVQDELDSANQKLDDFKNKITGKDNEIARLKAEIININQTNMNKSVVFEESHYTKESCKKCVALADKLESMNYECNQLQKELSDITIKEDSKCKFLEEQIVITEEKFKDLLGKEEQLKDEIDKLNAIIAELKANNQEQLEYLCELNQKSNDVSESSLSDLCSAPGENLGKEIIDIQLRELQQVVEDKDKQISTLQEEIGIYKNDLKISQNFIEEYKQNVTFLTDLKQKLEEEIENLNIKLITNKDKLNKYYEKDLNYQQDIELLTERLNTNIKYLNSIETLKKELNNDVSQKIEELECVNEEYKKVKGELNDKVEEINRLHQDLEGAHELSAKLNGLLEEKCALLGLVNNEKSSLIKQTNSLKENIAQLENEIKNKTSTIDSIINKNNDLNGKLKSLNDNITKITVENNSLSEENSILIGKVNENIIIIDNYKGQINHVQNQSIQYINESTFLKDRITSLENDIVLLKGEINKLSENEINLKTNIRTLNSDLFYKNRDIRSKDSEIKLLKDNNVGLKDNIGTLQKEKHELNETYTRIVKEHNLWKETLIKLVNEHSASFKDTDNINNDFNITTITERIKRYNNRYIELLSANGKRISELQDKIDCTLSEKTRCEYEIKNLIKTHEDYKIKTEEEKTSLLKNYELVNANYNKTKLKINDLEKCIIDIEKKIRTEYEYKLTKLKTKMKQTYEGKLEDLTFSLSQDTTRGLKDQIRQERGKVMKLESQLLEYSDKLLIIEEENRRLLVDTFAKPAPVPSCSAKGHQLQMFASSAPITKAHSAEVITGRNNGIDNLGHDLSPIDSLGSGRRSSIRSLPRGIGRVFPAAEEQGEVFDDGCLSDLKAGIVNLPDTNTNPERMSVLQLRNSFCPPHLKSSYPVETQFLNPDGLKEEDIKISYRKPSTPSTSKIPGTKVGGVLKEHNKNPVKLSTPSRIKALFGRKQKDQNSPATRPRATNR